MVGGSLGAKALNDSLPAALALMPAAQRPLVTHQSGKKNIDALRASYRQAGVDATVVDFIDDMARAYAEADLVICRAGAITVSELTAAGVASVLVPLVASTTSHQRDNARWMAQQNAAIASGAPAPSNAPAGGGFGLGGAKGQQGPSEEEMQALGKFLKR